MTIAESSVMRADAAAISATAARLAAGELALIPTDTVYGLASSARAFDALRAARRALGKPDTGPAAWHAPSVATVLDALRPATPVHRRLIHRMLPGPVTISAELTSGMAAVRQRAGVTAEGVIDDGRHLLVRVSGLAWARDLSAACETGSSSGSAGPIVAVSVPHKGVAATTLADARRVTTDAGVRVGALVDGGPTQYGRSSTMIELRADGSWRVNPGSGGTGAIYDEAYVRRQLQRTVLFVCTGNTCRSPMAEAIASDMVAKLNAAAGGGVPTVIKSAGLTGGGGAGTTTEALAALRAIGVKHVPSRSKGLSTTMIDEADVIFAMTRGHAAAIVDAAPGAAGKVRLLNPRGEDIPDPIGGTPAQYTVLAKQMGVYIERRLRELDT